MDDVITRNMERENEQVWERRINVVSKSLKGCPAIGCMSLFSSGYLFYIVFYILYMSDIESKLFFNL